MNDQVILEFEPVDPVERQRRLAAAWRALTGIGFGGTSPALTVEGQGAGEAGKQPVSAGNLPTLYPDSADLSNGYIGGGQ